MILQVTEFLILTTQQYVYEIGRGGGQCVGLSGDNIELMQFELQPNEGFVNLCKSYRPKIHLILALVIYLKVMDFILILFQSAAWKASQRTRRIPTAVNGRSVCEKGSERRGRSPRERRC